MNQNKNSQLTVFFWENKRLKFELCVKKNMQNQKNILASEGATSNDQTPDRLGRKTI